MAEKRQIINEYGKVPPQDINLEEVVLSVIMLSGDVDRAMALIHRDVFYKESNAVVWDAITELHQKGAPVDVATVSSQLQRAGNLETAGGHHQLSKIASKAMFSQSLEYNCRTLYELYVKRSLIRLSHEIGTEAYDYGADPFALIENLSGHLKVLEPKTYSGMNAERVDDLTVDFFRNVMKGKNVGIPTGIKGFDDHAGGLQNSDLIVIGTFPSNGKTTIALNMLTNAGLMGYKGKIYSFEQSLIQLYIRQIGYLSKYNTRDILQRQLFETPEVVAAMNTLRKQPTLYGEGCNHINDLVADLRKDVEKQGVQFACVDYLGLMRSNEKKRNESIGYIANKLKETAKELNIPIVLLSQLTRPEYGKNPRPQMHMLKESGDIEAAADIVWLPQILIESPLKADYENVKGGGQSPTVVQGHKMMSNDIAKGRNCGTTFFYNWIDPYQRIVDDSPDGGSSIVNNSYFDD